MSDGIDFSHMAAEGLQERIQQVARDLEAKNNLGSVFIMVTYKDQDNKTRLVNAKTGNYYATIGAVHSWLIFEDAAESEAARRAFSGNEPGTEDRA